MDWGAVIAAGVSVAGQLLEDDQRDQQRADSRENMILQLQDNERDRAAQAERLQEQLANTKAIAELGAATDKELAKARIMGDVLLDQGKGQSQLMLEDFRSSAQAPERFNNAATVLANVLSR